MCGHIHPGRILQQELDEELAKRVANWQLSAQGMVGLTTVKPSPLHAEDGTGGTRSSALVNGKTYLVEWKDYAMLQGPLGAELRGRRDNLVRMLKAEPKPEEMLTLHCTGYFDDIGQHRYGLVFDVPISGNESIVSLNSLLREARLEHLPPLQHRFHIAYRLALSLSTSFFMEWLHKGLRSHNIIFIRNGNDIRWNQPYLCGFTYSRPDKQGETSEKLAHSGRFNVYRHPLTQNAPRPDYRKAFDVYSFGVILFEIATWRPAFKLWDQDAVKFQKDITSATTLSRIAHAMGTDYRDAMLKCLDGSFDHSDDVTRAFFQEVVEVLRYLL